jgi:methylmalonyl-CoA mutase N-terminal domain/subunit
MAAVEAAGGAVAALEAGTPQRWIAESAYQIEKDLASGARLKVGVNIYDETGAGSEELRLFHLDPRIGQRQAKRLEAHRQQRDSQRVERALGDLAVVVSTGGNVMPPLLEATRAGATLGEMADVLRRELGEFKEPALW